MNIEEDIHKLQEELKSKFNRLRNLYRENQCCNEFIRCKKLEDEYAEWREHFYQQRKWKDNKK